MNLRVSQGIFHPKWNGILYAFHCLKGKSRMKLLFYVRIEGNYI